MSFTGNLLKWLQQPRAGLEFSSDERIRLQHYTVLLLVGIPTMFLYSVYNFSISAYGRVVFVLLSDFGLLVGWWIIRNYNHARIVYQINELLFSSMVLYILAAGGESGSLLLWVYTFPLISFFLLGRKLGFLWNTAVLAATFLILWNPLHWESIYPYAIQIKFRFLSSYLIVSLVTYWFEYYREQYRIDIETQNQNLQKALKEVKTLSGLLPICASCKKVRDDKGYWNQIESYVKDRTYAEFSHSYCPECKQKVLDEISANGAGINKSTPASEANE